MITININPQPSTRLQVEIIRPDRKQREYKMVDDSAAAQSLRDYLRKQYIMEKMVAWLNQRHKALTASPSGRKVLDVSRLKVLMNCFHNSNLKALSKAVSDHRPIIEHIAPGFASDHHKYFQNTIAPILAFCDQFQTGEDTQK